MSKTGKIDLTLLKKFVAELENSLVVADGIRVAEGDQQDYLVELAKASGLSFSLSQEATMLVGDIQKQMMHIQNPAGKSDILEKLFGSVPGSDPTGGGPLGGNFGGGKVN